MTRRQRWAFGLVPVLLLTAASVYSATAEDTYAGSRFRDVWNLVKSDPYQRLPNERVTLRSFLSWGKSLLLQACRRTLSDRDDVLPHFQKLLHPNGICFAGTWNITAPNPYTGYFKEGSRGLLIARASVALSDTTQGSYRGFGLAGKIYPTLDPDHETPLETANFFEVDDLGGTLTEHFTESELLNQPAVSLNQASLSMAGMALYVVATFLRVDAKPLIRQLYPIAELGLPKGAPSRAPQFMMVRAASNTEIVDEADFRDELRVENYPDGLFFDILVSEDRKGWTTIGFIELEQSVTSRACEHRLHFAHPPFRSDN